MKQIIAVAVAHVRQCSYCIRGHTLAALRVGATQAELMKAIGVAAEMRAGGAYAHAALMITEIGKPGERSQDRTLESNLSLAWSARRE